MLRSLIVAIALLSFVSVSFAAPEKPRDPREYFFDESFYDFSEELEIAKEEGKKAIMVMFEMDECPFCHYMKTTILNQPDVQRYFKENFKIFSIDVEGDVEMTNFKGQATTMKQFAEKQYRVRATPVFAFFDLNGKYIKRARFTGKTRDKAEFMLLGQFVVDGLYEKTSFTRYKRSQNKKK